MILPWALIATVAVAAAAGLLALRRSSLSADRRRVVTDVAFTAALGGLVGGRALPLLLDVATLGALPSPRAVLSIGAGLSTPGAVLGGLVAGWIAQRRTPLSPAEWRTGAGAAALGLAIWSLLGPVRDGVGGVPAPWPLGWALPGEDLARVPVFALEAAAFVLLAWVLARPSESPRHGGAVLAAAVGGIHLAGSALRPSPPPVDEIVDVLAGVTVLLLALSVAAGRLRRSAVATGAVAAVVVVALAVVPLVVVGGSGPASEPTTSADGRLTGGGLTDGGLTGGDGPAAWSRDDLAAFVGQGDGRPVVVNFWASWCPPCHAEAPALARAARALADDATFVGVLVDDELDRGRAFEERYGLPFPTVVDGGVWRSLAGAGLPTTVVLRGDGSVASTLLGGVDGRRLAAAVDAAAR
jgi:thiol-disulfide isomerase/thioredoxin